MSLRKKFGPSSWVNVGAGADHMRPTFQIHSRHPTSRTTVGHLKLDTVWGGSSTVAVTNIYSPNDRFSASQAIDVSRGTMMIVL